MIEPETAVMNALPAGLTDRQRQKLAGEILLAIDDAGWRFASKSDDRQRVSFRLHHETEGGET